MRPSSLFICILLCFAFAWQICFFALVPPYPVLGDAKLYYDASHALASAAADGDVRAVLWDKLLRRRIDPARERRYQEWVREGRLLFIRGPLYPAYLSLFFLLKPDCIEIVKVSQAALTCVTIYLVYLIATGLGGGPVGMASLIIAAIYPIWAIVSSRILAEAVCVPLITWLSYLLLDNGKARRSMGAGLACGALALAKPALVCLIPAVILVAFLIRVVQPAPRRLLRHISALFLGIAVLLAPFSIATSLHLKKPALYNTACQHWAHYQHNCLEDDGFVTEAPPLITDSLISAMRARGYAPEKWVKDQEAPSEIYLQATNRSMLDHPLAHLVLAARKFYRQWSNPWNGMRLPTLFPHDAQCIIHKAIVLLAIVGIPFSFRAFPLNLALLPPMIFCSVFYPFTQSGLQYNIIAMPSMIVLCAWALVALPRKLIDAWKHGRHPAITIVLAAAFMLALFAVNVPVIYGVIPSAAAAKRTFKIVHSIAFLGLAVILYQLYHDVPGRLYRMLSSLLLPLILIVQTYVAPYGAETWHEWTCALSRPGQRARQLFRIAPETAGDVKSAVLLMDITGHRPMPPLSVRVNEQIIKTFPDGFPIEDRLRKYVWVGVYPFHIDRPEQLRDWLRIPLDPALLKGRREISVELSIPAGSAASGHYSLSGDYPTASSGRIFRGPALGDGNLDTSQERWEKTGDIRMERATPLGYEECVSYFDNGDGWRTDDLAGERGIQQGQYRIRIMLTTATGQAVNL